MVATRVCMYPDCPERSRTITNVLNGNFRCRDCHQATYCSRDCQSADWKRHRKPCRAWKELNHRIQSLSVDQLHQQYDQTNDTIQKIKSYISLEDKEKSRKGQEMTQSPNREPSLSTIVVPVSKHNNNNLKKSKPSKSPRDRSTKLEAKEYTPLSKAKKESSSALTGTLKDVQLHPSWNGTIEYMMHIHSYHINLYPKSPKDTSLSETLRGKQHQLYIQKIPLKKWNTTTKAIDTSSSSSSIQISLADIFSCILPKNLQIYSHSCYILSDGINIRLQCQSTVKMSGIKTSRTTADAPVVDFDASSSLSYHHQDSTQVSPFACKSCRASLLLNEIKHVVPLPTGHWNEIAEYLQCYDGKMPFSFTESDSVPLNMVWENPSLWVIHPVHLQMAVQPLHTDYLYETHSKTIPLLAAAGIPSWEPIVRDKPLQATDFMDEINQETILQQFLPLTCATCCSQLGYKSPQGYHIYRHRVISCLSSEIQEDSEQQIRKQPILSITGCPGSISIFVAQEMKRYAESHAVFSFFIAYPPNEKNHHSKSTPEKSEENSQTFGEPLDPNASIPITLLLHIVSWESTLETLTPTITGHPKPVAKVIYKLCNKIPPAFISDSITNQGTFQWTWGDLCCEYPNTYPTNSAKPMEKTIDDDENSIQKVNLDKKKVIRSVQIMLDSKDEWLELIKSVRECPFTFLQDIVSSTAGMILGKEATSDGSTGMAAIPLC
jgi:MYND finger